MNDLREERELEAYLAGETPVSKRYGQLADEQPPAELDARILAAAQTELKVVAMPGRWRRWGAAVGIAATVVLALSLVLQFAIEPMQQAMTRKVADEPAVSAPMPARDPAAAAHQSAPMAQRQLPAQLSAAAPREQTLQELRTAARQEAKSVARQDQDLADVPMVTSSIEQELELVTMSVAKPSARDSALTGDEEMQLSLRGRSPADDVSRAVAVIRDYQAGEDALAGNADAAASSMQLEEIIVASRRVAEPARKEPPAAGLAGRAQGPAEPEQALVGILQRYDAGDLARAGELLNDFMLVYPEHPVTRRLEEDLD